MKCAFHTPSSTPQLIIRIRIATSTLRTVEKTGGIDSFLLNAINKDLSSDAKKYKKSISKATLQDKSKKD